MLVCELPIGFGAMIVSIALPSRDLCLEGLFVGDAAAQALPGQNGELGLGHVEPHIEQVAQFAPPALDVAGALALAAVVVIRGGAEQRGGGLITDASKLGHPGDHACDRLTGKPGHALDDFGAAREAGIGLDFGADRSVEGAQLGSRDLGDRAQRLDDQGRGLMTALLLDLILDVFEDGAGLDQTVDFLSRAVRRLGAEREGFCEPGDRLGVDPIILGEPPGRLGEMAHPLRIDDDDFDPVVRSSSAQLRS